MNFRYQILFVVIVVSALNARISERHQAYAPLNPDQVKLDGADKSFKQGSIDNDDSVMWKRRHKRRKKARRSKRGR